MASRRTERRREHERVADDIEARMTIARVLDIVRNAVVVLEIDRLDTARQREVGLLGRLHCEIHQRDASE